MLVTANDLKAQRKENNITLTQKVPPEERQQALETNEYLKQLEAYAKQLMSVSGDTLLQEYNTITDALIQCNQANSVESVVSQLRAAIELCKELDTQNKEYKIKIMQLSVIGGALQQHNTQTNELSESTKQATLLITKAYSDLEMKRSEAAREFEQNMEKIKQRRIELKQERATIQEEKIALRTEKTELRKEREASEAKIRSERIALQKEKMELKEAIRAFEEQQKNFKKQKCDAEEQKESITPKKPLKTLKSDYKEYIFTVYGRNKGLQVLRDEGYDV